MVLTGLLGFLPLAGQSQIAVPATNPNPALLRIRVVEGDEFVYLTGSRATRGVTVFVSDETGQPVSGATVSFRLPDSSPTGTFANGGKTDVMMTDDDGRAEVWGMQWNDTPGRLELRVTAAKGEARAGTLVPLYLMEPGPDDDQAGGAPVGTKSSGRFGGKKLWITVATIGAAVSAVAGVGMSSGGTAAAAPQVNAPRIGTPDIVIGAPPQ